MREKRRERPRRCVGAPLCNRICSCRSSIRFFSVGQKNFLRQRRCCAILLRRFVLGRGRRYAERCPSWPKEHDWKSCMPQKGIWGSNPHLSARLIPRASSRLALIWRPFAGASPLRRGGRVVECGGLENRLPLLGVRGFESLLLRQFSCDISELALRQEIATTRDSNRVFWR